MFTTVLGLEGRSYWSGGRIDGAPTTTTTADASSSSWAVMGDPAAVFLEMTLTTAAFGFFLGFRPMMILPPAPEDMVVVMCLEKRVTVCLFRILFG